ncbi:hypothetical protein PVV74_11780 [Roseovarius sp. SK2]|uniref:hypothetical protein n=1 Tax=Roseovarius TaxID=74030 RepID=UPI00237AFDB9|nr:hypothetical protein [Roseovarius sp. SK2]MDD9726137.1 hypothetical protein [Roseovarius sp. SK2]
MSSPRLTVNKAPVQIRALDIERGPSIFEGEDCGVTVRRTTPFPGSTQIQRAFNKAHVVFHWPIGLGQPSDICLRAEDGQYDHIAAMAFKSTYAATEVSVTLDR